MEDSSDKQKLWREQKRVYRKSRKEYTLIMSLDEAKRFEGFANEKNMQLLEFIKSLLKAYQNNTEYILPKENMLKELILEMRKIGNNINQMARIINTNKTVGVYEIQHLQDRLSELEKVIVTSLINPVKKEP